MEKWSCSVLISWVETYHLNSKMCADVGGYPICITFHGRPGMSIACVLQGAIWSRASPGWLQNWWVWCLKDSSEIFQCAPPCVNVHHSKCQCLVLCVYCCRSCVCSHCHWCSLQRTGHQGCHVSVSVLCHLPGGTQESVLFYNCCRPSNQDDTFAVQNAIFVCDSLDGHLRTCMCA